MVGSYCLTTGYILLKTDMILYCLCSLKQIKRKVLYREAKSTTEPPAQRGRGREQNKEKRGIIERIQKTE